jgi:hypothetical protein
VSDELHTVVALIKQGTDKLTAEFYRHAADEESDRRVYESDRKEQLAELNAIRVTLAGITSTLAESARHFERMDRLEPRVNALELEAARGKGALYVISSGLSVLAAICTAWIINLFKH